MARHRIPRRSLTLRLALPGPLEAALAELSALLAELPEAVAETLADIGDDGAAKLFEIGPVTAGRAADEGLVAVAPSGALGELVAALRAGEHERFVRHWNALMAGEAASVGGARGVRQ